MLIHVDVLQGALSSNIAWCVLLGSGGESEEQASAGGAGQAGGHSEGRGQTEGRAQEESRHVRRAPLQGAAQRLR